MIYLVIRKEIRGGATYRIYPVCAFTRQEDANEYVRQENQKATFSGVEYDVVIVPLDPPGVPQR